MTRPAASTARRGRRARSRCDEVCIHGWDLAVPERPSDTTSSRLARRSCTASSGVGGARPGGLAGRHLRPGRAGARRCPAAGPGHRAWPAATRAGRPGWRRAARAISRAALSSVSSHSASGSERVGDPGPGAEVQEHRSPPVRRAIRGGEEGADADRQPGPAAVGVDVADGAAVGPAGHRLQFGDHLLRADLRRAGDRAGREGGGQDLRPADAVGQPGGHGRHQVGQTGVLLPGQQLGDRHRARAGRSGPGRCGPGR